MQRTPEEIANTPKQEQAAWLLDPNTTPRQILEFDRLTSTTVDIHALSRAALSVRISEVAELSTRRIVYLTWGLLILTAVLAYVAWSTDRTLHKLHRIAEIQDKQPKPNASTNAHHNIQIPR